MKIYSGKIKTGKTTNMLKDFAEQTHSLFVTDDTLPSHLYKKCIENRVKMDNLLTNSIIFKVDFTLEDLEHLIKIHTEVKKFFIDVNNFYSEDLYLILRDLEQKYGVELYLSYLTRKITGGCYELS